MSDSSHRYCDVSLPVPVDRLFTYELPQTLRHRVETGSRVLVPFGSRRLVGVVMRLSADTETDAPREVLKLIDEVPVLDADMLRLGQWVAEYYCAPLGEVLRGMLPLSGESRKSVTYTLSETGRDVVVRQILIVDEHDAAGQILKLLEVKPRTAEALIRKFERAKAVVKSLIKRGWVSVEEGETERDPLRASANRLQVEFRARPAAEVKLKKTERELLAYLELHPGAHRLTDLAVVKNASPAARFAGEDMIW